MDKKELKKLDREGHRFNIGDVVGLNDDYGGKLVETFRGEIIRYSKKECDRFGNPCVRVERLDLKSGRIETWGQEWLKVEALKSPGCKEE